MGIFETNKPKSSDELLAELAQKKKMRAANSKAIQSLFDPKIMNITMQDSSIEDNAIDAKLQQEKLLERKMHNQRQKTQALNTLTLKNRLLEEGKQLLMDQFVFDIIYESCWIDPDVKEKSEDDLYKSYIVTKELVDTNCEELKPTVFMQRVSDIIESTCKTATNRICESQSGNDIDFSLTDKEQDELDRNLSELGRDEIVELIKQKVLQVVQDEKESSKEKAELFKELQSSDDDDTGTDNTNDNDDGAIGDNTGLATESTSVKSQFEYPSVGSMSIEFINSIDSEFVDDENLTSHEQVIGSLIRTKGLQHIWENGDLDDKSFACRWLAKCANKYLQIGHDKKDASYLAKSCTIFQELLDQLNQIAGLIDQEHVNQLCCNIPKCMVDYSDCLKNSQKYHSDESIQYYMQVISDSISGIDLAIIKLYNENRIIPNQITPKHLNVSNDDLNITDVLSGNSNVLTLSEKHILAHYNDTGVLFKPETMTIFINALTKKIVINLAEGKSAFRMKDYDRAKENYKKVSVLLNLLYEKILGAPSNILTNELIVNSIINLGAPFGIHDITNLPSDTKKMLPYIMDLINSYQKSCSDDIDEINSTISKSTPVSVSTDIDPMTKLKQIQAKRKLHSLNSASLFESIALNDIKTLESTMEGVDITSNPTIAMATTIAQYTILETFNTLKLYNMNLSSVTRLRNSFLTEVYESGNPLQLPNKKNQKKHTHTNIYKRLVRKRTKSNQDFPNN